MNRITELIDITGISKEQHKKINSLSKGYRQRVGLAQCLINDPEILILDEPTSGLDPNQMVDIRKLIKNLAKEKTVVLSSHILGEIEILCNRVVIIDQGKKVADQPTSDSLSSSEELYRLDFVREPQDFKGLEHLNISRESSFYKISGIPKEYDSLAEELFFWAVNNGYVISYMEQGKVNVEELFQRFTAKNDGE